MNPYVPNLVGRCDTLVERAIRELYTTVNKMAGTARTPGATNAVTKALALGASKGGSSSGGGITGPLGPTGNSPFPQNPQFPVLSAIPPAGSPYNLAGTAVLVSGVPYVFYNNAWIPFQSVGSILNDTHAHRLANFPATSYAAGTLFYETDRTVVYISDGTDWLFLTGVMHGTLSPDQKPGDLGATDFGFIFNSTDFLHFYEWDGTAWHFASGDGSKQIVGGDGAPPDGGLWQLCDGSTVDIAQDDGTVVSTAVPTVTGMGINWYERQ